MPASRGGREELSVDPLPARLSARKPIPNGRWIGGHGSGQNRKHDRHARQTSTPLVLFFLADAVRRGGIRVLAGHHYALQSERFDAIEHQSNLLAHVHICVGAEQTPERLPKTCVR